MSHAQHLNSKSYALKFSQDASSLGIGVTTVIQTLAIHAPNKLTLSKPPMFKERAEEGIENDDEWADVNFDDVLDEASKAVMNLQVKEDAFGTNAKVLNMSTALHITRGEQKNPNPMI